MEILYVSPNYKPEIITDRYLHIDLQTNKPIVSETVKTQKTNYTYRSYILPENEYGKYADVISTAIGIKYMFPFQTKIDIVANEDKL